MCIEHVFGNVHDMNSMRRAEELMCEPLADLPESELVEELSEVERIIDLLEIQRLRRLAEITRRSRREYAR